MLVKPCICCSEVKSIDEYYIHPRMGDGHLNKCKACCRLQSMERENFLRATNPVFVDNERTRGREKYKRLYRYRKPNPEVKRKCIANYVRMYPEKKACKTKTSHLPKEKGHHLHHWSYNIEYAKDVIKLTHDEHYLIHRFIKYDKETKFFISIDHELLDTREKHLKFINNIIESALLNK